MRPGLSASRSFPGDYSVYPRLMHSWAQKKVRNLHAGVKKIRAVELTLLQFRTAAALGNVGLTNTGLREQAPSQGGVRTNWELRSQDPWRSTPSGTEWTGKMCLPPRTMTRRPICPSPGCREVHPENLQPQCSSKAKKLTFFMLMESPASHIEAERPRKPLSGCHS